MGQISTQKTPPDSHVMRILIVDDDAQVREALNAQLRGLVVRVGDVAYRPELHFAEDGARALQKIQSHWFDTVITDLQMPQLAGLDLLGAIRGEGRDIPVIVLTGTGTKATSIEALRLGCYGYLEKPWKHEYLAKLVVGAVTHGVAMRDDAARIEMRLRDFPEAPAAHQNQHHRQNQLRNVFRSMQLTAEVHHRRDVCLIPPRVQVGRGTLPVPVETLPKTVPGKKPAA